MSTTDQLSSHELPTWAPLPARPDAGFDELARRTAGELRVPRALVVLLSKMGQVYPGAFGLDEPWESRRSMPLTHSISLRVAATGRPVVLCDAREDAEACAGPAVQELSVVAYAAMPLTDAAGRVIGTLAVSDVRPRDWTPAEVDALRRLAAEAARRLRVQALDLAEREALAATARADDAARKAAASASAALLQAEAAADRARLVARLSQELLPVQDLLDVLRTADRFLRSPLGAAVALLGLAEGGSPELRVWEVTAGAGPSAEPGSRLRLTGGHPLAVAARERRIVPVPPGRDAGPAVETAVAVPVVLGQQAGALLVGWDQRRELDAPLQAVVVDLARHVGHALDRVLLRAQRLALAASPPG